MEDPEVERVEESVVESRPVEAEEEKALLEEARKEAGVLDKVVEKVEEPVVESPVEVVPDKAVEKVEEVADKVDEVVEKVEETVVELLVEALEVERRNFSSEAAARHSIVFRPRRLLTKLMRSWIGPNPGTVLNPNRDLVRNPVRN